MLLGLFVVLGGVSYAAVKLPAVADQSQSTNASERSSSTQSQSESKGSATGSGESGGDGAAKSTATAGPSKRGESVVKSAPPEAQILANRQANTVHAVNVGEGEYLVVSSGQITNSLPPYGTKRRTECTLYNGTTALVSADSFTEGFQSEDRAGSDGSQESIAMRTTVKVKNPSVIALKCSPQDGRTKASMSLTIQRVG